MPASDVDTVSECSVQRGRCEQPAMQARAILVNEARVVVCTASHRSLRRPVTPWPRLAAQAKCQRGVHERATAHVDARTWRRASRRASKASPPASMSTNLALYAPCQDQQRNEKARTTARRRYFALPASVTTTRPATSPRAPPRCAVFVEPALAAQTSAPPVRGSSMSDARVQLLEATQKVRRVR